jgi:hypothetical protein
MCERIYLNKHITIPVKKKCAANLSQLAAQNKIISTTDIRANID